ncbi:MAG: AraC family transcriptional regulator [Clostridiales Family XIII bacterium]|nr:AraC family transcriptional regulator [Clostridiales Family XIII bacterium]
MSENKNNLIPKLTGIHLIDESHSNKHARLVHLHEDELELFFVYSGEGQYSVDGKNYEVKTGDMIICNAGTLHGEDPSGERKILSYCIALTNISIDGLPDNTLISSTDSPIISCLALENVIRNLMKMIYTVSHQFPHMGEANSHLGIAILEITQELIKENRKKQLQYSEKSNVLANRIKNYLDNHFREPLTLNTISKALNISEYYLAHVFKEEIGIPPMQYVTKRRIGEAQTLLMDTCMPIAEISDKIGCNNPWHFTSVFNKFVGTSPSKYRESFHHMKEETET